MRASSAALVNTRAACARRIPTRCRCRGHRACQHGRGDRCGELPALVVFAGVSGQHAHAYVLLTSVTVSARAMTGYRCGKNAGRVDVGDGLLHQGVQLPVPLLSALSHRHSSLIVKVEKRPEMATFHFGAAGGMLGPMPDMTKGD